MTSLPKGTIDEAGHIYGRLTVLEYVGRDGDGSALWRCSCACGSETSARGKHLRTGRIISCGCARRDPLVRQAARLQTPPRRRKAIAKLGQAAWQAGGCKRG